MLFFRDIPRAPDLLCFILNMELLCNSIPCIGRESHNNLSNNTDRTCFPLVALGLQVKEIGLKNLSDSV